MNINYGTTPGKEISGGKVILRPLEKQDLSKSLRWLTDPLVNKYLSQNFRDLTGGQEEKWFDYIQDSQKDMVFAILDRDAGLHIGNCALHKINKIKSGCELGIVIGEKEYWDKGYGTDSVKALVGFALADLRLSRIKLNVYTYNHRAIRAYSKCGFGLIRVLKRNHLYDGKYWDTLIMEYAKKPGNTT
ncbi:MAG: GNAT family N-acetyltransferase [Actinomycetia bacterium]|nr:GNAT family N-acetyltransferase [Actinomycetes bacterium]